MKVRFRVRLPAHCGQQALYESDMNAASTPYEPAAGIYHASRQRQGAQEHQGLGPSKRRPPRISVSGPGTPPRDHGHRSQRALEAAQMLMPASTASRSIAASSSSVKLVFSAAARFSSSWVTLLAPISTEVTR